MSRRKSVEGKLWESFRYGKGVTLTAREVAQLMIDDAIRTRVSNAAAIEAGGEEPGVDCVAQYIECRTWEEFGNACCGPVDAEGRA